MSTQNVPPAAQTASDQIDAKPLTGNQKNLITLVIVANISEFFDMFLIGFVVSLLTKPWNLTGWEAGIIEEYTGHGIGTKMHMEPEVLNFNARGRSPRLKKGMVLAVEPMLVSGGIATRTEDDGWTVRTEDGGDAAHWEHTIAIAEGGVCVLTARDGGAAGLAPYGVAPISLD